MSAIRYSSGPARQPTDALARRVFDLALALAGLVLLAPLMLPIALLIRLDTPGPVLFRQPRLGQGGHRFWLYKFRKFTDGPHAVGLAVTLKDDPRMTRVGRWLERAKLDELPQLWNILVGDMSVVGPRPETLDFADCFAGEYEGILDYRPGLFGPSQATFRNESSFYPAGLDPHEFYRAILFPAKAQIDLSYFPTRTMMSDIGWIIRGLLAVAGVRPVAWDGATGLARPPVRRLQRLAFVDEDDGHV